MSDNVFSTSTTTRPAVDPVDMMDCAVQIVSAYASSPGADPGKIPDLLETTYRKIAALDGREDFAAKVAKADLTPAVPVKKSITPDFIICLEDGKKFKSLKRHLKAAYGLTPEQYREKWHLQADYPMVAPNYSAARSDLAKKAGLGQVRKVAVKPSVKKAA